MLDIGGWNGCSAKFWREHHPAGGEFEIHVFECDAGNLQDIRTLDREHGLNLIIVPGAAWINDEPVRFYFGKSDGGSLCSTKTTGGVNPDAFVKVPAVDLAAYIRKLLPCDELVIKMNCEGAEYALIKHLHEHGLINKVTGWYVQWHYHKIGMTEDEHNAVKSLVPRCYEWRAQSGDGSFRQYFLQSLADNECGTTHKPPVTVKKQTISEVPYDCKDTQK